MPAPQWQAPGPGAGAAAGVADVEEELCAICWDNPKQIIFDPCGHHIACKGCTADIQKHSNECPICRVKIYTIIDLSPPPEKAK